MQLSVHGKQIDIGDALRQHVAEQLPQRVTKYFDNPTDASVTFSREGKGFRTDIVVHVGKDIFVQSHGLSEDPYGAFDLAAEHAAKRLRRYKRRLRDHHRGRAEKEGHLAAAHYVLEAEPEDAAEPQPDALPVVVAEMATVIEALTVSEAVMRMDLLNQPALLFRNRSHGAINMVYRRNDGHIGWIDPQDGATR